ncbi:hypothetical protein M2140_001262 [Clostridiales Family XIII bacterium PM5-7]
MEKNCSLCGNIYHNTVFRGGFVCEDCIKYIKQTQHEKLSL